MLIKKHSQKGFSLIELAVVLVIIGALVGSFIGTLGSRIDTSRRNDTRDQLEEIKTALYGFAMSQVNPRLPCPDTDNDGREDPPCAVLTTRGGLPWQTLGIQRGDVWGSNFSYWVNDLYSVGFNVTTNGTGVGQIRTSVNAGGNTISNNVAAVIFSHGKNQYGSTDVAGFARPAVPVGGAFNDERENQDVDAAAPVIFVSRPVTDENTAVVFDDIVLWISEFEIKGKMVQAGALP